MILLNTSIASTPVRVLNAAGTVDYVHIAGRGKIKLPEGFKPDPSWLNTLPNIRVTDEPKPKPTAQQPQAEQKADPKPQGAKE